MNMLNRMTADLAQFRIELPAQQFEFDALKFNLAEMRWRLNVANSLTVSIIESAAGHLAIPMEKIFVNLDKYGNTSAATIPIALDEASRQGRLKPGQHAVLVAFGGGLTWASALLRW